MLLQEGLSHSLPCIHLCIPSTSTGLVSTWRFGESGELREAMEALLPFPHTCPVQLFHLVAPELYHLYLIYNWWFRSTGDTTGLSTVSEVGKGKSCRIEPLTCGFGCCLWVDGVRIELKSFTPSWCQNCSVLWGGGGSSLTLKWGWGTLKEVGLLFFLLFIIKEAK